MMPLASRRPDTSRLTSAILSSPTPPSASTTSRSSLRRPGRADPDRLQIQAGRVDHRLEQAGQIGRF